MTNNIVFGKIVLSWKEVARLLIASLLAGFIISFRDWGPGETVDVSLGLKALFFSIIISFILLFLITVVQKFVAYKLGYEFNYEFSLYGLAASVLIVFFSYGLIPLISPSKLEVRVVERLRLGSFRGGLNYKDLAIISLAGPLTLVLLMILVKPFFLFSNNFFVFKIISLSAALSISSLIPIPTTPGFNIFYYRRWLGVFVLSFALVYFSLILFFGFFSYFVSLILAWIITYAYIKAID